MFYTLGDDIVSFYIRIEGHTEFLNVTYGVGVTFSGVG
jgi:hypothetical protein